MFLDILTLEDEDAIFSLKVRFQSHTDAVSYPNILESSATPLPCKCGYVIALLFLITTVLSVGQIVSY